MSAEDVRKQDQPTPLPRCRLGYCAVKDVKYGGGWNERLAQGKCAICGNEMAQEELAKRG